MAERRGRPSERVMLRPSERATLLQWTRRRSTAQGLAQRARIVLACTSGRTDVEIGRELRVHRLAVGTWRRRFQHERLDGLLDEPRPGAPLKITHAMIERVITDTLETTRVTRRIGARVPYYATHKTAAIRRWLAKRPRYQVHFTPTSASWLNLVERWFVDLTQKQIRRGVHRSTRELVTAIERYLVVTNETPKPLCGTRPLMRFWPASPDSVSELLTRNTRKPLSSITRCNQMT